MSPRGLYLTIAGWISRLRLSGALLLLALILGAAVLTRVPGIWMGLPDVLYGDERATTAIAFDLLQSGNVHTAFTGHMVAYPAMYIYLQVLAGMLFTLFASFAHPEFQLAGGVQLWHVLLLARIMSVIVGMATVLATYTLGTKVFGRRAALFACIFVAFNSLYVETSQQTKVSVLMPFLVLISVALIQELSGRSNPNYYALAGLCIGFATVALYPGGIAWVAFLLAYGLDGLNKRRSIRAMCLDARPYVAGLSFMFGYALFSIQQLTDLPAFLNALAQVYLRSGGLLAPTATSGAASVVQAGAALSPLVVLLQELQKYGNELGGTWLAALAFGGLILTLVQFKPGHRVLTIFTIITVVVFRMVGLVRVQDPMAEIPFLLLFAGYVVDRVISFIGAIGRLRAPVQNVAMTVVTIALVWQPADLVWKHTWMVQASDWNSGRVVAREWILRNIPAGATIHQLDSRSGLPLLPPKMYNIQAQSSVYWKQLGVSHDANFYRAAGIDYLIADDYVLAGAPVFQEFDDPVERAVRELHLGARKIVIYKLGDPAQSFANVYATLQPNLVRTSALNDPSFEDSATLQEYWFPERTANQGARAGEALVELVNIATAGQHALHLAAGDPKGSGRASAAQVIPADQIEALADFSLDFYPLEDELTGTAHRINVVVTAQSASGVDLGTRTYHLWSDGPWSWKTTDLDCSEKARLGAWNTFSRNLKADLLAGNVPWQWVRFVILKLEVATGNNQSRAGVYFDNIQTEPGTAQVSVSYCGVTYRVLPDVHNDVVCNANRTYSRAATSYANLRTAWLEDRATRARDSSARPSGNCAGQGPASCPVIQTASSSLESAKRQRAGAASVSRNAAPLGFSG